MAEPGNSKIIQTVLGPIPSSLLDACLIHEHVLVDFIGASRITRDRYDRSQAFNVMLPYLLRIKRQGFEAFAECTPMFLGRDPVLLQRLSSASGLHLITNTGLYAAGERDNIPEPYLPDYAYKLNPDQLSGAWIREWFDGIEGTTVRPGFIKIGVNRGPLREISQKIVRAAAKTSRATGLVIAAHTGNGQGALEILKILAEEEVAPDRYIFVHAQSETDFQLHLECARRGVWIEYDGIGPKTSERHLSLVKRMLEAGFEDQILISQDAGWYRPGEPEGGAIRGFEYLHDEFVPALHDSGIPQATLDHLLIHNPRRALEIQA